MKITDITTEAFTMGKMPDIDDTQYQNQYNNLFKKSTKISDIRSNVELYLYDNKIYLLVKDKNIILGHITTSQLNINNQQYCQINSIYIPKLYRKTSVASWLVYAVKEVNNLPVVADGNDLINSIIKHKVFNVSKLNKNTTEKLPLDGPINDTMYCYLFDSANLGFTKQIFEGMPPTWLPLFDEI